MFILLFAVLSGLSVSEFSKYVDSPKFGLHSYFILLQLLKSHDPRNTDSQNAGRNDDMKTANESSGNVLQFKYFETAVTNHNSFQEEIKKRLNTGKACYHSDQNFCLLICCLKSLKN
jgi:hypothetical protein